HASGHRRPPCSGRGIGALLGRRGAVRLGGECNVDDGDPGAGGPNRRKELNRVSDSLALVEGVLDDHGDLWRRVRGEMAPTIAAAGDLMVESLGAGNLIMACGNGGSAADAQHFAAELVGRFVAKERRPRPAAALT